MNADNPAVDTLELARAALRTVIDPELGYNIVDLGLVYAIEQDAAGGVHVRMTTTTRGCPATDYLVQGAQQALQQLPGCTCIEVELTYDPPWSPERISPVARLHLGIDRASAW